MNVLMRLARNGWAHVAVWTIALIAVVLSARSLPAGAPVADWTMALAVVTALGLCVTAFMTFRTWLQGRRR